MTGPSKFRSSPARRDERVEIAKGTVNSIVEGRCACVVWSTTLYCREVMYPVIFCRTVAWTGFSSYSLEFWGVAASVCMICWRCMASGPITQFARSSQKSRELCLHGIVSADCRSYYRCQLCRSIREARSLKAHEIFSFSPVMKVMGVEHTKDWHGMNHAWDQVREVIKLGKCVGIYTRLPACGSLRL